MTFRTKRCVVGSQLPLGRSSSNSTTLRHVRFDQKTDFPRWVFLRLFRKVQTGADDTVFPEDAALALGTALTQAPCGEARVVGGARVQVRYAQVTLRITD